MFSGSENGCEVCASDRITTSIGSNETAHASSEDVGGDTEEFDPIGTLTLIAIYFAILVLAWVYIYYIEFLGRDLVVVG